MGKRRKAREIVLQALYEAEFSDATPQEILDQQMPPHWRTGTSTASP
jgi:transcription termination factor NusB